MTTASHARDGTLSVLEALGRDASRLPGGARRALSPSDAAAWSAFGSAATDQQRINLVLRPAAGARELFFNAGSVLDEDAFAAAVDTAGLPQHVARALSAAARAFLEAAEGVVDRHRTRLYLGPGSAPAAAREDCVVLDWKRIAGDCASAVDVVPVEAFVAGDWDGLRRADDPRHALAAHAMMAACDRIVSLLAALHPRCERVSLSIRTFDPAA